MAILIQRHTSARVAVAPAQIRTAHRRLLSEARRRPTVHLVPSDGVLVFPGTPDGIAPPAQLGPWMTPHS